MADNTYNCLMRIFSTSKGFSLVETMVAVGLTAGIGYMVMTQSEMSKKQQIKSDFNGLVNSQVSAIQKELSKSENCTATFQGLQFGTSASPVSINEISKGIVNTTTTPPTVTKGDVLFRVKQPGAVGLYIDSMHMLRRSGDNKDVLRVMFVNGDVAGTATRQRSKGYGASVIPKDFIIMTQKNAANVVQTCFSESTNLLSTACASMPGGVWNPTTQKCDISGIVKRSDLVQLWLTKDGTLTMTKPADTANGQVTCQKSGKRCSRTNADCSLPACPPNHYQSGAWEWDRKQSMWDYACMKSANCMYVAQPAGWMVKP